METVVKLFGFVFVSLRLALYNNRVELGFGAGHVFGTCHMQRSDNLEYYPTEKGYSEL